MFKIEKNITDVITNHYKYDANQIKENLINQLNTRFEYFINNSKSFLIEDYIENEWRDSFELYYSRTNYKNIAGFTKRIHFISKEITDIADITDLDDYIGYITLRPLPVNQISRVRFKCTKHAFREYIEGEDVFCLSMDTTVNLPHKSFTYSSFPIYCQDSMVTICAHASILMLTKYMYKKFNFNNYRLKDIVHNNSILYNTGRKVPSEALTVDQIMDILTRNKYNPVLTRFINGIYGDGDDAHFTITKYIDSFLESGIPVIVAYKEHVSIIIGHLHNNKLQYIIADDSSFHISKVFEKIEAHVAIIPQEEFLEKIKDKKEDVFVIAPTIDRLYLHYKYLNFIIESQISEFTKFLESEVESEEESEEENEAESELNIVTREILVESSALKQFLHNEIKDRRFENIQMPHYVWYIEFYAVEDTITVKKEENLLYYSIIDASAHKFDLNYSVIKDDNGDSTFWMDTKGMQKKQISRLSKLQ